MRYYFRKSHIPKCCPDCGAVEPVYDGNIFILMSGWQHEKVKRHPLWRFQCYRAYCMNCIMIEELMRKDFLLSKVVRDKNWQGGTLSVPFKAFNGESR